LGKALFVPACPFQSLIAHKVSSQFIQNILQVPGSILDPNVSDILRPCVNRLVQYRIQISSVTDRQVVLVDTPGFDRGSVGDALENLRQISVWLASLYVIFLFFVLR
jgi:hypothetical protein